MTTTEFISSLAQTLSLSKTDVAQGLEQVVEAITAELTKTHVLALGELGTFDVEKQAEQVRLHPGSGKRMLVPPQLTVRFTSGGESTQAEGGLQRVSLQEMAILLAEKSSMDGGEAEAFLQAFATTLRGTILGGEAVHIERLGSFQCPDGDSQSISFVPDSGLAAAVNEPFALFESVELDEEEASEADQDSSDEAEDGAGEEGDATDDPPVVSTKKPVRHHSRKRKKRKHSKLRSFLFSVIVVALSGLLVFIYFFDKSDPGNTLAPAGLEYVSELPDSTVESDSIAMQGEDGETPDATKARMAELAATPTTAAAEVPAAAAPASTEPAPSSTVTAPPSTASPATPSTPAHNPSIRQYRLKAGDRLTTIALREYGRKVFWVYLYEENKAIIANPNIVPEGTTITLPEAAKYGIDKNNSASLSKAAELQQEYSSRTWPRR
jgi:nucleoid DNA-binding protein/nucleoid-associated protein YgaU